MRSGCILRFIVRLAGCCLPVYSEFLECGQGGLRFVGVGPRNAEEIKALASDWKFLYLKNRLGIVTETRVNFGAHPIEDEIYSAEAFYCVSSGWKYDLKFLARYFGQLLGLVPLP